MKMKKNAGMSLGMVIIFITLMSVVALAMIASSLSAFRTAQILPQMDGDHFSAEAAMNRAVPLIAAELADSPDSDEAADGIRNELMNISNYVVAVSAPTPEVEAQLFQDAFNDELANEFRVAAVSVPVYTYIVGSSTPNLVLPGRLPTALGAPTTTVATGSHHFRLTDSSNFAVPAEGFGAPAFVNLARVNAPYPAHARVDVVVSVSGSIAAGFIVTPTATMTVLSESGGVVLQEEISFGITPFNVNFDNDPWNQNTVFNQGLGPGGFTFRNEGGVITRVWVAGVGAPMPTYPEPGSHPPGANDPTENQLLYAYNNAVRANPAIVGVEYNGQGNPGMDNIALYSTGIPAGLRTFVRALFPNATFHGDIGGPGESDTDYIHASPHAWTFSNPIPTSDAARHASLQRVIEHAVMPAGAALLPVNGHFGGMSEQPGWGIRCPYRHALYYLYRLAMDAHWADLDIRPFGIGPNDVFPSASELPPSGSHATVYVPGLTPLWRSIPDQNDDMSDWLRASGYLATARYLYFSNGANSNRHLHGSLNMPELRAVHSGNIRLRSGLNFSGYTGSEPNIHATRFNLPGDLFTEHVADTFNATINNAEFVMSGNVLMHLGLNGTLLGNALYMGRGDHFTINGSGTPGITIGAPDRAPQFYSVNHMGFEHTVGIYHGVFSTRAPQITNPPADPSVLRGIILGNYHPQAGNVLTPHEDPLTATIGNGGMLPNLFEEVRDIVNLQGGSSNGNADTRLPPSYTDDATIGTPRRPR